MHAWLVLHVWPLKHTDHLVTLNDVPSLVPALPLLVAIDLAGPATRPFVPGRVPLSLVALRHDGLPR